DGNLSRAAVAEVNQLTRAQHAVELRVATRQKLACHARLYGQRWNWRNRGIFGFGIFSNWHVESPKLRHRCEDAPSSVGPIVDAEKKSRDQPKGRAAINQYALGALMLPPNGWSNSDV